MASPTTGPVRKPRVLAVASGGGHWIQLQRILPALAGTELVAATVHADYAKRLPVTRFHRIRDASRTSKVGLAILALEILMILVRERPDVIISTGAAPGYVALRLGKLFGARTIWVDSIANVERLSLSGERVGRFADLWLTQWEHLSRPGGPIYKGSIL